MANRLSCYKLPGLVLIFILLIFFVTFGLWERTVVSPAIFYSSNGTKMAIKSAVQQKESNAIAFLTFLPPESSEHDLMPLLKSLHAHILSTGIPSQIFIIYSRNQAKGIQKLRTVRFVTLIPAESFDQQCQHHVFASAITKTPVSGTQLLGKNLVVETVPFVLEYLLVEHSMVIFIDSHYAIGENTIGKIFEKSASLNGQVLVPSQDYAVRGNPHNPDKSPLDGKSYAMFAYTRQGYSANLKPYLDYQRGFSYQGQSLLHRGPAKTVRRSAMALYRHSGMARKDNRPSYLPLLAPLFTHPKSELRQQIRQSSLIKVALALELELEDVTWEVSLRKVLTAIESYSSPHIMPILYLGIKEESAILKEILNQHEKTPIAIATSAFLNVESPEERISLMWSASLQDGCEHFYHFGNPPVIPRADQDWISSITRISVAKAPRLHILTMITGEEETWMLKELIGSIHGATEDQLMEPPPLIIIAGSGLSKSTISMIKLWQYVEYLDMEELFFGYSAKPNNYTDKKIHLFLRSMLLAILTPRYGSVLYWDIRTFLQGTTVDLEVIRRELVLRGVLLARMNVHTEPGVVVLEGYDVSTHREIYASFLKCLQEMCSISAIERLIDYKRFGALPDAETSFHLKSSLPKPSNPEQRGQMYCHLSLRQDIMYTPVLLSNPDSNQWAHPEDSLKLHAATKDKTKIAILIPSKNSPGTNPKDAHLLQTFLSSLVESINADEWARFFYIIYVGYDANDPVLDARRNEFIAAFDQIVGHRQILIKFVRLPTVQCVTMLWNILFSEAVVDGSDYFYQVNDDVKIMDSGWSDKFVGWLRSNDDFGVVGPNDQLWQCRLLTQSFVSRKHHEIFHWYFPTIIKDWYSDNWISQVYSTNNTKCFTELGIRNGASGTRYNICNKPKWREAVADGQRKIKEWKDYQIQFLTTKLDGIK